MTLSVANPFSFVMQVSNAQEELLQWYAKNVKDNPKIIHATERCASGIIQAIGHFKLGTNLTPRDAPDVAKDIENASPGYEIVKLNLLSEKWRRAEVEKSEQFLAGLEADCVCMLSHLANTISFLFLPKNLSIVMII